nr:Ycf1 [Chlorogonium euchlorum]
MIPVISLVTSVKDYLEVVHKLIEYDSINMNYTEFGTLISYFLISVKTCVIDFFSFSWLNNIWSLPVIMPEISSAMISEISVLDGYFHNAFNFLETPVSYGEQNSLLYGLEKFTIGILNSLFLFLPTSTAHIITLRRFVMQGLDAGYMSGLGTIAGNVLWLTSVIFGWRFFVIPWLSLDIFRYLLGFVLLIKYMWDSYIYKQKTFGSGGLGTSGSLDDISKRKIFLLNFLLALTEQTSIYPFISNLSISPETSLLESFPADTYEKFIFIHFAYLLGITLGCFSLLHFTCWFWENPAFKIYMWVISSFKVSTSFYYKAFNFTFLYLTMISAISSIPYYGLDYTITNPLGYVNDDRIIQDKLVLETSFLGGKASDRNTRRNRGRHGRRERWKRRIRKYRTFDASLYDQGIYDLFTIEDLNYGFDRFWLRRKLRNHRVRFRFFPGPWMRTFKKQLAKPRLESYTGPRSEFFRILFEQVYHPSFHAYESSQLSSTSSSLAFPIIQKGNFQERNVPTFGQGANIYEGRKTYGGLSQGFGLDTTRNIRLFSKAKGFKERVNNYYFSIYSRLDSTVPSPSKEGNRYSFNSLSSSNLNQQRKQYSITENLIHENSTLRKFVRKLDTRLKTKILIGSTGAPLLSNATFSKLRFSQNAPNRSLGAALGQTDIALGRNDKDMYPKIYSKQWKHLFSKLYHKKFSNNPGSGADTNLFQVLKQNEFVKKQSKNLSKKDFLILRYRSLLAYSNDSANYKSQKNQNTSAVYTEPLKSPTEGQGEIHLTTNITEPMFLLHPLKFYLQREAAFKRKLRYYSPSVFRKFSIENNAPYFRVMMRRYFYNYKPSLRWERTMKVASLRKARRKTTRLPRKLQLNSNYKSNSLVGSELASSSFNTYMSGVQVRSSEGTDTLNVEKLGSLIDSKRLQKPTFNYSVVSKKASRYRYQIYKDVLQHWYYSPFNRLLLKLDVDSFIRRQPNAHFLTAKEENLLHLRRFLISEHYNTLRWYTNMEHYRSMKTRLGGGNKSFASRAYNQQFSGTFKKIRHLFAITPSQGQENVVLKFDQPLYNETPNNSKNPLLNQLIIHEELNNLFGSSVLEKQSLDYSQGSTGGINGDSVKTMAPFLYSQGSGDLLSQSQNIVREYLTNSRSAREEYIKNLLNENNYTKLTRFLYKGQKVRGTEPTTNQRLFNNQEKDALLTQNEKRLIFQQLKSMKLRQKITDNNLMEDLYVTYLKKWKRKMNDQEALKNYLSQRIEKREKRKQKKEKHLLNKLKRLENWFENTTYVSSSSVSVSEGLEQSRQGTSSSKPSAFISSNSSSNGQENKSFGSKITSSLSRNDVLTTGLQKAIFESMSTSLNVDTKVKTNDLKTFWKVLLLSKIKQSTNSTLNSGSSKDILTYKDLNLRFNDLKNAQRITRFKSIQASTSILRNLLVQKKFLILDNNKEKNQMKTDGQSSQRLNSYPYREISSVTQPSDQLGAKKSLSIIQISNLYKSFTKTIPSYLGLQKIRNLLKPIKRKSLKNWRKKERASGKQKRSRKEFKMLNKKVELKDSIKFNSSDIEDLNLFALLNASPKGNLNGVGSLNPIRQKRDMQTTSNMLSSSISNPISEVGPSFPGQAASEYANQNSVNSNSFMSLSKIQRMIRTQFNSTSIKGTEYNLKEENSFKRKRSPQRRSRTRRNRGVFRKRTLSDSVNFIKKFYKDSQSTILVSSFINKMNTDLYALSPTTNGTIPDNQSPLKQRKSKQRKERVWKQKRSKFSQKRRKYRKRKRYSLGKIRILSKQLKRVKNKIEINYFWWKQFVPSIQASTDALWQIEKDKLIQQKLSELSSAEILERDQMFNYKGLQIGNKDFKPLALPEAIRIKDSIIKNQTFSSYNADNALAGKSEAQTAFNVPLTNGSFNEASSKNKNKNDVVNKLYENLFIRSTPNPLNESSQTEGGMSFKPFMIPNTMLPFYAGWDESLRKFVVTNRMLSRQDAGYSTAVLSKEMKNLDFSELSSSQDNAINLNATTSLAASSKLNFNKTIIEFAQAPVQGMNAATTLYWQIPFTTYDPDQFFALGMDGFSPIGWRKFLFRHSILKTWLNTIGSNISNISENTSNVSNVDAKNLNLSSSFSSPINNLQGTEGTQKTLIVKSKTSLINMLKTNQNTPLFKRTEKTFDAKNTSRRLKKRYRRVKKHPRTPVWFPSGPLLNQVLPVHYIYVFYKRARLPRDRYLKRRLLNTKMINKSEGLNTLKSFGTVNGLSTTVPYFNYDFTLRKRLKPKRKYHLKRDFYASNVVIPRRFKFISTSIQSSAKSQSVNLFGSPLRWRPLSSLKINKPIVELVKEQKFLRSKQRRKDASSKQQTNLRVKQLRRRVQRQVLRSVWRYRPRAGGFVWPGDYLKLELVKAPKLQMPVKSSGGVAQELGSPEGTQKLTAISKSKRKKKRTLVEWQIQPKKYLYEKHNIKVLKKKLEKSFRSDKLRQKIKELNYKL